MCKKAPRQCPAKLRFLEQPPCQVKRLRNSLQHHHKQKRYQICCHPVHVPTQPPNQPLRHQTAGTMGVTEFLFCVMRLATARHLSNSSSIGSSGVFSGESGSGSSKIRMTGRWGGVRDFLCRLLAQSAPSYLGSPPVDLGSFFVSLLPCSNVGKVATFVGGKKPIVSEWAAVEWSAERIAFTSVGGREYYPLASLAAPLPSCCRGQVLPTLRL